jgi:hypothetical protein
MFVVKGDDSMKTTILLVFCLSVITSTAIIHAEEIIQMAILLDTSGSMDGLIDQAKTQLWKIVNELALARKNGESPLLEVALYEYGKDSLPANEGYMRMIVPLTTDLDRISEELFKLTTDGGSEYCGEVIGKATRELQWSSSNKDYRVIFIAGNEPFTQGTIDYTKTCPGAIARGIIVNTIFCGDFNEGVQTEWKAGAELADGTYMNIDHNQTAIYIDAPQDEELLRLGRQLNETYVAYGTTGGLSEVRQEEQDMNAASMSKGAAVERSVAKAQKMYVNSSWDIVDAVYNDEVDIASIKEEQLPEEMKKMSPEERKEYVAHMKENREEIQKKINILNEERRTYIEEEMKKKAGENTLDMAIVTAVRDQAAEKDYHF